MNEEVTLYDGKVTLKYRDVGHAYSRSIDNGDFKEVVGVTTIINKTLHKEGLSLWPMYEALNWLKEHPEDFEGAEKAHVKKSDKGKDTGTLVHGAIELLLKESLPHRQYDSLSPQAKKAVDAFGDWFLEHKPEVLATEQLIYSLEHDYAGRTDAILEMDGKVYVSDIKTNNRTRTAPLGVYDSHIVQLGGYSLAYREMGNKVDDLMVIAVDKSGKLDTVKASDLGLSVEFCEDAFLQTCKLYKFLNPLQRQLKEKKNG